MALIKVRSNENTEKATLKVCMSYALKYSFFNIDFRDTYVKYLIATCYPEFLGVNLHFEKKQWPLT